MAVYYNKSYYSYTRSFTPCIFFLRPAFFSCGLGFPHCRRAVRWISPSIPNPNACNTKLRYLISLCNYNNFCSPLHTFACNHKKLVCLVCLSIPYRYPIYYNVGRFFSAGTNSHSYIIFNSTSIRVSFNTTFRSAYTQGVGFCSAPWYIGQYIA